MYGSLVVGYVIGCTTSGWYHGGINMCGSSAWSNRWIEWWSSKHISSEWTSSKW
jgi:hypothetical protein